MLLSTDCESRTAWHLAAYWLYLEVLPQLRECAKDKQTERKQKVICYSVQKNQEEPPGTWLQRSVMYGLDWYYIEN